MLLTRIGPSMAKITQAQLRYAACQPALLQSVTPIGVNKMSTSPIGKKPNELGLTPRFGNQLFFKQYSTNQPELPSKQELQKYFFKVTVVIYDLMVKITMWAWAMFRKHFINNPTVQTYWKSFNEKLEEARKN